MRDVLLAYLAIMKAQTSDAYEVSLQVWASLSAFGGKAKPPEIPDILR